MIGDAKRKLAYNAWEQTVDLLNDAKKDHAGTTVAVEEAVKANEIARRHEMDANQKEERAWMRLQFTELKFSKPG